MTQKVADKTLGVLEEEGVFIFPSSLKKGNDITKDEIILKSSNEYFWSSNVMGFLGLGDECLIISSRFSDMNQDDFLFKYLI